MKRKPSPAVKTPASKPSRAASGPRTKAPSSPKPAAKKAKAVAQAVAPQPAETSSKQSQLITLLRKAAGTSMADMMALTGWQSHTVRGMLSGSLRKRLNLDVQCQRVDGVHLYRIVEASAT
jgi:Protein of unknown function (DUF3489)